MSAPEADADIPFRENLGGWLRLALTAVAVLFLPVWLFASVAVFEAANLPFEPAAVIGSALVGAVAVLVLVPVPLLLLLGGAALDAARARWEHRRTPVDDVIDRDAVMAGVAIRSRVEGAPTRAAAIPRFYRQAELAPVGTRVAAALVDWVLAWTVPGALALLGFLPVMESPDLVWIPFVSGGLGALAVAGGQTAGVVVSGQTLGKRLLGIRIVTEEGQEVGFVDGILLRYVVWSLLVAIPLVGAVLAVVDLLALLTDPARQSLHDQLARTLVVGAAPPAPVARPTEPAASNEVDPTSAP